VNAELHAFDIEGYDPNDPWSLYRKIDRGKNVRQGRVFEASEALRRMGQRCSFFSRSSFYKQGKSEGKEEEHGKAYFRLRMFGLLAEKLFCLFSSLAGLWWCGVIGEASPYEVRSRVWQPLSLSLFQLITAVENKV